MVHFMQYKLWFQADSSAPFHWGRYIVQKANSFTLLQQKKPIYDKISEFDVQIVKRRKAQLEEDDF